MKRSASLSLQRTGHANKRQKPYRTNLKPGQPKTCHICHLVFSLTLTLTLTLTPTLTLSTP